MGTSEHTEIERWVHDRDGEAFRRIVENYGGMVFASARRVLGSAEDAAEVAQECFAVLAGLSAPPRAPLGPWLHRVATNRALNRRKADQARLAREARSVPPPVSSPQPEWRELEVLLDQAIASLPERYRVLVVGHFLLGESHRDLAVTHGLSRQTVTHRLAQALDLLRRALRKRGVTTTAIGLAACFDAQARVALPEHLLLSAGKHAMAAACGVSRGAAGALSTTTWGMMIMAMKLKIAVAACGAVLIALAWQSVVFTPAAAPPGDVPAAMAGPAPARVAMPAEVRTPVAQAAPEEMSAEVAVDTSGVVLPVAGVWRIESHVWENPMVGGAARETYDLEEIPEAAVWAGEDSLRIQLLEPWDQRAVFGGTYEGTVSGRDASLWAREASPPFLLNGTFNENLTQFTGEGRYTGEAAARPPLAAQRLSLVMRRAEPGQSVGVMAATELLEQRRLCAKQIASALYAYARDHDGQLPATLDVLIPDYLDDPASVEAIAQFAAAYDGGAIPAGLLEAGTPWAKFEPGLPMAERLEAWEDYQRARWGGESPLLPPVLRMEYRQPLQSLYIDALGRISERDYAAGPRGEVLLDEAQLRQRSMNNLRQLGLGLYTFQDAHDAHLPAGWLSLHPAHLDEAHRLTHPADPPGTLSYRILLPAESVAELATGQHQDAAGPAPQRAAVPVAAERQPHGVEAPGYNVVFADGSTRFLGVAAFENLCTQFGVDLP